MSEEESNETEVTRIVKQMQGPDTYASLQAMQSLREYGEDAVPHLIELLSDGDQNLRWRAAMALAHVGEPSVGPLLEIVTTRDDTVRNPAIWALAEIKSPHAVEPLVRILEQESSECCRVLTAAALLKIDHPTGIDAVNREIERSGEEFHGMVTEAFVGS